MRVLALVLVSLFFTACSTPKPVTDKWTQDLVQKEGFLSVPPNLEVSKEYAKPEEFSRCDKITITGVKKSGSNYFVEFTQQDKKFLMSGIGGTKLWSDKAANSQMFAESFVIGPVQRSLVQKLPFHNEKVTYDGKKTPIKTLMCDTPVTWKGMKQDQFYFVMGYPVEPKPHFERAPSSAQTLEYVYAKRQPATYFKAQYNPEFQPTKEANYSYYYFKHGKLN